MMTKKTFDLTKGEAYLLFTSVMTIASRNKQETFLNYELSVKLLSIKKALQLTMDALEEAKLTIQEVFSDRVTAEYELPVFSEEDLKVFIKGPDELEIFEKLVG
ncbi:MAG: hypothetical protein EBU90_19790 [Proteobacteria bacterium]|jgi:hypothetical protein|nr:hypothetical protein [Pseudomonadota bacterium]